MSENDTNPGELVELADASEGDALLTEADGDAGESEGDSEDVAQNGNDLDEGDDDDGE